MLSHMSAKRSYGDGCAAAHALDLIGERWGLLIVRELLLGPKRFTDLRAGLKGISANVLSQRLTEFETAGIVVRQRQQPPAGGMAYVLTPWGQALEPILLQLLLWGVRSPNFARGSPLNVDAMVLSLRAMFDPDAGIARDADILLVLDGQAFRARLQAGAFDVRRADPSAPAMASLHTAPTTLLHLAYGKASLDAALADGRARLQGERGAIDHFLNSFSVPRPETSDAHGHD